MPTSDILIVVLVIATLAVVARVLINRQQSGKSIAWNKVVVALGAAVSFALCFALADPYRVETWQLGNVSAADLRSGKNIIGRHADTDSGVAHYDSISLQGMPLFFTVSMSDTTMTGLYMRRDEAPAEVVQTDIKTSRSDDNKIAIERTTRNFQFTHHPDDPADYLPIVLLRLSSGQQVLSVMPSYDYALGSSSPVATLRPLPSRMQRLLQDMPNGENVVSEVYLSAFDHHRFATAHAQYPIRRTIVGLIGAVIVAAILLLITYIRKKK